MTDECGTDFDCPDLEVCYRNVSWLAQGESLCACEGYFGWTGDDCRELSQHSYVYMGLVVGCMAIALVAFFYNIRGLWRLLHIPGQRKWDLSTATLIFTLVALVGIIIWRVSTLLTIVTPRFNTVSFPNSDRKLHPALLVEKFTLAVATVFSTLAMLNISILWLEVAKKTARMLNTNSDSIWGGFARRVYIFEACFFLVLAIAVIKVSASLAALLSLPFVFIIGCTYAVGLLKMNKLIRMLSDTSPESRQHASRATGASSGNASAGGNTSEASVSPSGDGDDDDDDEDDDDDGTCSKNDEPDDLPRAATPMSRVRDKMVEASSRIRVRKNSLEKLTTRQQRERKDQYVQLLSKIRVTATLVLVSITCLFISTAVYSLVGVIIGSRDACPPDGKTCVSAISSDLMAYFVLFSVIAVEFDVYQNTKTLERRYLKEMRAAGDHSSSRAKRPMTFRQSAALQPAPAPEGQHSAVAPSALTFDEDPTSL